MNREASTSHSKHQSDSFLTMKKCKDPFTVSKKVNLALVQLACDILTIVAKGEKSAEIIRKVMFELPNFQAYHIYQQIRKGAFSHAQRQRELTEDGSLKEFPKTKAKGIDDLQIFSFFKANLQPGTLK